MDFYAVLDQVLDLLRQRGRVTYNALKRQFGLDEACLQDLKDEIIAAQRVAVDEGGTVLVWTGDVAAAPPPAAALVSDRGRQPDTAPLTYTPPTWPRRSWPPAPPWKASASRSPCSLPTSRAPWS